MQTGKLRRTVCKLQQLRDDFYAFPKADITLWVIQRTDDSLGKLPPGLEAANRLFTVLTLTCEYYITTTSELDEKLSDLNQTFCSLIKRSDYLLKEANLTPKYDHDATLYAVAKMAINGDISTSTPHCWQGGSLFAKSMVDGMRLPIACSDWFVTVDELPEAIGDTLDELLNRLEQSTVVEPSDPPVSSEEKQLPSKPEPSEPAGSGTYIKLLSAYTNGASDTKLEAMAMVIDGKGTIDEKTERLNSLLSLSTLSGETIGNLLGCTKQAIFKTRYWVDNRKDDIAKRSEDRRNRLSRNGKQYEQGADDE